MTTTRPLKRHDITVKYTGETHTTGYSTIYPTPLEVAARYLMSWEEDQDHSWEPRRHAESITVDGHTFTLAEVRAWRNS